MHRESSWRKHLSAKQKSGGFDSHTVLQAPQRRFDHHMKECSTCKKTLPLDSFHNSKDKTDGKSGTCIFCRHEYSKRYYQQNKKKVQDRVARNRRTRQEKIRMRIVEILKDGCVDCGENDIRVLDFDHVDPIDKVDTVSKMIQLGNSESSILEEVSKCEIRCANCHRIRTSNQFNWWRSAFVPADGQTQPCEG